MRQRQGHDTRGRSRDRERDCPHCGDPLPLDGACDCAGDPERDDRTGLRGLGVHALLIRLGRNPGDDESVVEMWV